VSKRVLSSGAEILRIVMPLYQDGSSVGNGYIPMEEHNTMTNSKDQLLDSILIIHPVEEYDQLYTKKGVSQYARSMTHKAGSVNLIAYERQKGEDVEIDGVDIRRIQCFLFGWLLVAYDIYSNKYTSVIVQGLGPRNGIWAPATKLTGGRYIVLADYTTDKPIRQTTWHRALLRVSLLFLSISADVICTQTTETLNDFMLIEPRLENKLHFLPSSLSEEFYVSEEKVDKAICARNSVFLYVGRIDPDKNVETIVRSFENMEENFPEWELRIIGRVESDLSISTSDKVKFMGYLTGDELVDEYLKADVFCFASAHESFSFALIEAAATGNTIISTKVGIAPYLLENAGTLINKPDVTPFSKAMARYAENPGQVDVEARKLYKKSSEFHQDPITNELISIIKRSQ